jgi:hypothetical protein
MLLVPVNKADSSLHKSLKLDIIKKIQSLEQTLVEM